MLMVLKILKKKKKPANEKYYTRELRRRNEIHPSNTDTWKSVTRYSSTFKKISTEVSIMTEVDE